MNGTRGTAALVLGFALIAASARAQDRQLRGFVATTFGADTTFVDLSKEHGPGKHLALGAQAAWLGEIVGVDADFADIPGFFEGDPALEVGSRITTFTGDVVVAMPRRRSEYSLRLYFVGGGGIMRVSRQTAFSPFDVSKVVPAMDLGAGALGFLTDKVGLSWELRRFREVGEPPLTGLTVGPERLSFWRAQMALVLRY